MLRKTLATLCLIVVSMACMASCLSDDDGQAGSGDIVVAGQQLPAFSVIMADGREVTPASLAGRPAVIVFFSTVCGDCRRELPEVQRLFGEYGAVARFVCISRAEGAESVEEYWQSAGLTLPYSAQADRTVYNLFAQVGIPRVYVTDASGTVRAVFSTKTSYRKLKAALEKCLPEVAGNRWKYKK